MPTTKPCDYDRRRIWIVPAVTIAIDAPVGQALLVHRHQICLGFSRRRVSLRLMFRLELPFQPVYPLRERLVAVWAFGRAGQ
jgi:hypothetical protein